MYAGSTAILGIYYWDQASGEWLAWADGMLEATLGTLQTGEAYWFMVSPQGEIKVAVI
ncbi:MAG TPA: hypothetical protein QGF35_07175 [Dehalococcoidia bacterium]|nr:hypothetical protein [Dehalococcoidia bacterium]